MEGLVRVRSSADLRPGMSLYEVACPPCRRSHWFFILRPAAQWPPCSWHRDRGILPCPVGLGWVSVGCVSENVCLGAGIMEGRLFRLPDETLPEETIDRVRAALRSLTSRTLKG